MSNHIDILFNQAVNNFQKGNFNQVKLLLNNILLIQPNHFDALHLLGVTLGIQNHHKEALVFFTKAVKLNPSNHYVNFNLAKALSEMGRDLESLKYHRAAVNLSANNEEAWLNFGKSLFQLKHYDDAILHYDQAIKLKPDYAEAWSNKGLTLDHLKYYEDALSHFNHAIKIKPNYAEPWCNKGVTLNHLERYDDAIFCFNRAIQLKPDYSQAWFNRGFSLNFLNHYNEALADYDIAIQLKPDYAEAWSNKGSSLNNLKRYEEALTHYDKAIELKPDLFEAYFNKSLIYLTLGIFDEGWDFYEKRWAKKPEKYRHGQFQELDSLDNLENVNILVWHEQGFGDSIQFSRFIPLLIKLGANVTFQIQKPLLDLFAGQLDCNIKSEIDANAKFDFQVPLLKLPKLFNTSIHNIPPPINLLVNAEEVYKWKSKLGLCDTKLKIGLAVSGNPHHENDFNRSMQLKDFSHLFNNGRFFIIQKELSKADLSIVAQHKNVFFLGDQINDFLDTASIIMNMDIIISVDTSLIHLAASLNKESYLMLAWCPEWRWLLDRSDSPWYSSVEIFRQKSLGDWDSVTNELKAKLEKKLT
jgi:tetratricopeptide (TPR) repeat protein